MMVPFPIFCLTVLVVLSGTCSIWAYFFSRLHRRCAQEIRAALEIVELAESRADLAKSVAGICEKMVNSLHRSLRYLAPENQVTNAIVRQFIDSSECEYAQTPKGQCKMEIMDARCTVCEARWQMRRP